MQKLQTVIFLIRHGQTDQPFSAVPGVDAERQLTEEGSRHIEKVGEYLKSFAPIVIYSSPLKRTVQTAVIIQRQAAIPGEIIKDPSLIEMYHGQGDYAERATIVGSFFKALIAKHAGEQIVLVSHQDPIESIVDHMGFTAAEIDRPCLPSQGYRVVFAGDIPVECQKINPAGV